MMTSSSCCDRRHPIAALSHNRYTACWHRIASSSRPSSRPRHARLAGRVHLVCFVYLVDLVHLVSFVQPKNQTDQTNQITFFVCWRDFSTPCSSRRQP